MTIERTTAQSGHVHHPRLPFVGRDTELKILLDEVANAPSTTVVSGTAGIGKTRLLAEVTDRTEGTVLYGRGWRGADTTPYVPWTQVLSTVRQLLGPHETARFRDLAPLLSSGPQQPRFAQSESMQHVLGLALGDCLRQAAAVCQDRLVVVLDDLHHADSPSITLALAISRQRLPIALLTTSRPLDEANPQQRELLAMLRDEADVLELQPLAPADVETILALVDVPPGRIEAAVSATSGLPLLLDHWVRSGAHDGVLDYQASVGSLVSGLGAEAESLLQIGALAGDVFDLSVVSAANQLTIPVTLGHIERAVSAGLVSNVEGSLTRFRFNHESVRELLEKSLPAHERAEGHSRLLSVLLDRRGTAGDVDVSILAAHASEAAFVADPVLIADLNIEAGEAALARAAPGASLINFQRAIDISAAAGSPLRTRVVAELGMARAHKMAEDPRAATVLIEVLEIAERHADVADLGVEAALLLPNNAGALGLGADRDAVVVRWLEWALDVVGDEPSALRARLLLELGLQTYTRSASQGELLVVEAAGLAQSLGHARLLVQAVCHRHWFRRFPGDMADVLKTIAELETRLGVTDAEARLSLAGLRTATLLRAGRFTEALAEVQALEAELAPLPPPAQWSIERWQATIHYVRGDHRSAEAAGLAAFARVDKTPLAGIAFDYLALLLASVMHARMQHETIIEMTASMVEAPTPLLATSAKAGAAMVLAELGRGSEARDLLAQVPRAALDYRDPYELAWLPGAVFLSQAAVALDDAERAKQYLDALEPYRNEWVVWGSGFMCFGPVALRRAQAALVAGRGDIAADDLALARREIIDSGARMFEPPLLCAEADLALLNGQAAAGVEALCQASALCTELDLDEAAGMLAARAMELSDSSNPAPPTPGARKFSRQGAVWAIEFDGEAVSVAHVKGMVALATLMDSPGREFHALELAAVLDSVTGGVEGEPLGTIRESATPILDAQALSEYRRRVSDLQAEISEASDFHDGEREAIAQREMDAILDELQRSTGVGGQSRSAANNAERARVRITKSIRSAIRRIDEVAPNAGRHLSTCIATGAFCVYEPRATGFDVADRPWSVSP